MIKEIVKPTDSKLTIDIPKEYLNMELEITIKKIDKPKKLNISKNFEKIVIEDDNLLKRLAK